MSQSEILSKGDKAPLFTTKASLNGKEFSFSLEKALEKGPVVVYFYPAAFTRGCDIEAHTFAVHKHEFEQEGASIIGLSADKIEQLNKFSADPDFCAGEFPVGADPNGDIAAKFGLDIMKTQAGAKTVNGKEINHGFLPRTTFVIGTDGKVLAVFSSQKDGISPAEHVTQALKTVENL